MRKCTIHGTELNCAANVIGGQCGGILQGTEVEYDPADLASAEVDHAHDAGEANERLGDFAEVFEEETPNKDAPDERDNG